MKANDTARTASTLASPRRALGLPGSLGLSLGIHGLLLGGALWLGPAPGRLRTVGAEVADELHMVLVSRAQDAPAVFEPPPPERVEPEPQHAASAGEADGAEEPEALDVPWWRDETAVAEEQVFEDVLFDPDPLAGDLSYSLARAAPVLASGGKNAGRRGTALGAATGTARGAGAGQRKLLLSSPHAGSGAGTSAAATPAGSGAEEARLVESPPPAYPALAFERGEQGTVLCRLHVSESGAVTRVELVESSGYRLLDEAACRKLSEWRFQPRREGGRAVATTFLHMVVFRIEG